MYILLFTIIIILSILSFFGDVAQTGDSQDIPDRPLAR